jgi:hypothetical protein
VWALLAAIVVATAVGLTLRHRDGRFRPTRGARTAARHSTGPDAVGPSAAAESRVTAEARVVAINWPGRKNHSIRARTVNTYVTSTANLAPLCSRHI